MDLFFWRSIQRYLPLEDRIKAVSKTWIRAFQTSPEYRFLLENKGESSFAISMEAVKSGNRVLLYHFARNFHPNLGLGVACREGNRDFAYFFMSKGADDLNCMAIVNRKDLALMFVSLGANNWNEGLKFAAKSGNREMIDFFIAKGANNLNNSMHYSAWGGHLDVVKFFIAKGANDYVGGLHFAGKSANMHLVYFFISLGVDDWDWAMQGAFGADRRLIDLYIALGAQNWKFAVAQAIETRPNMVFYFIARGFDDWRFALKYAKPTSDKKLIDLFLALGAK